MIDDELRRTRAQQTAANERFEEWRAERKRQSVIADRQRATFVTHCRLALPSEYADWLRLWIGDGGRITDTYDYPFTRTAVVVNGDLSNMTAAAPDWMVLCEPPDQVPSLYGARSMNVIVPADVDFSQDDVPNTFHGGCGHSTFYFMRDGGIVGSWVPLYPDVEVLLRGEDR